MSDIWLTPPFIIEALGGPDTFDLDPCAQEEMPWATARERYTEALDGLMLPWHGRVWLNPPYSLPSLRSFLERMVQHDRGTALIFAKTETSVFQDCVWQRAAGLLFIRGRVFFHRPDGSLATNSGGCGSVLVAYGRDDLDVLSAVPIEGAFIPLRLHLQWLIPFVGTWDEELHRFFDRCRGPVTLAEIYHFFAGHPKAEGNQHYREKIRQVLQKGRFRRIASGVWARQAMEVA